ncbi:MAG: hypothetical protein R6V08_00565 [Desulfuromonadales bacterium]
MNKLFGGGASIETVRRALAGQRWAEALIAGERIDRAQLDEGAKAELVELLDRAGDSLAAFNLEEARGCLRSGEMERASEHLDLAEQQVRSRDLAGQIADQRKKADTPTEPVSETTTQDAVLCSSGCGSGVPESAPASGADMDIDEQTHLDLILATYPDDISNRYEQTTAVFKRAFLLAHENQESAALELLNGIPDEQRDDLFFFERGALKARLGKAGPACNDLEEALKRNPELALAFDALIRLLLQSGKEGPAVKRLRKELDHGRHACYCCARLAEISARRGEHETALQLATRSFDEGNPEPETVLLTASLLEREGRLGEAEALLTRLGGGGCAGGNNVHLAEFWLRHSYNLDKALEAFKGAARKEPDEPRWTLRMAQVSLARGWRKDGNALLQKALANPRLTDDQRAEGEALLPQQ